MHTGAVIEGKLVYLGEGAPDDTTSNLLMACKMDIKPQLCSMWYMKFRVIMNAVTDMNV
jgi:hypothetical protein